MNKFKILTKVLFGKYLIFDKDGISLIVTTNLRPSELKNASRLFDQAISLQ